MSDPSHEARVAVLETELRHITEKVDAMSTQMKEVHDLLMQARGARWAILGLATVGGFVSAKIGAFIPWFGALPK